MKATLHHSNIPHGTINSQHHAYDFTTLWNKFIAFAEKQQPDRLLWIAIGIFGHGIIFTPLTMGLVFYTSHIFGLLITACFSMILVVIVTLAALPTKYIIPAFLLSLVIDVCVIISALVIWIA
ncbi:MAG: hypothetical protein WDM90_18985 [Ferruginibacter sp.]